MTTVNYDMVVTANSGLNYRTGPGIQCRKLGAMTKGTTVHCTETQNGWYKHSAGWSDGRWLRLIKDYGVSMISNVSSSATQYTEPPLSDEEKRLLNSIHKGVQYESGEIDDLSYVFGAPMQFCANTDPRPSGSEIGRSYLTNIVSDMDLLIITPGKANFMAGYSDGAVQRITRLLVGQNNTELDNEAGITNLKKILAGKQVGRYYTFTQDYTEYMKYVNNMCRMSALLLKIGDKKMNDHVDKDYAHFDWSINNLNAKNSGLFSFLIEQSCVCFFIDAKQTSYSDGMNNSTGDSMLAGTIGKTASDYVKEAMFLFGKAYQDSQIIDTSLTNYETAVQKVVSSLVSNTSTLSKFADRANDYASTLIKGGNIAFPELWKDSTYNKSYNISIKLVSPYGDVESFYLYILVPLFHLIAMSYPRQLGANGYNNPFLVRAFCKSWFNCSLGIIDSIGIKRASQDGWSTEGYPTEVDVDISIRDLYQNLTLSRAGDWSTFHNIEFLDMLATWTGVNINKPEIDRNILLYQAWLGNLAPDLLNNVFSALGEDINKKIRDFLGHY